MECFDKDGNFFIPKRLSVIEAYILHEMEKGKSREQVLSEMELANEQDSAPF